MAKNTLTLASGLPGQSSCMAHQSWISVIPSFPLP
jgi:hypothetical protein